MGDITGTTFAGHEVRDVIRRDLVSTIYRATEPEDGRQVALRVVADDLCAAEGADRELYERFHRRASAALTFEHPNMPTVEEVGEHRGAGYLISSYVDTISLATFIAERGPLALDDALPLFEQIADVLDASQRAGLTHGAVSPSTLRVTRPDGDDPPAVAYLTGHGVGALLELRLRRDRKRLRVVDDLLYVAPEQLRQQPLTGRTDQYAMTCALVHALTGAPPFTRDSVGGLFGAHLFVTVEYDPSLPWALAVRKGMDKEPRDRYATCGQLITDIARAARSAVNRRNAATRRRLAVAHPWAGGGPQPTSPAVAATEPGAMQAAGAIATDVVPAEDQRTQVDSPGGEQDVPARGAADEAAGTGAEVAEPPVEASAVQGPSVEEAGAEDLGGEDVQVAIDDAGDEEHAGRTMTYAAQASESANGVHPADSRTDADDVPLLSEVLSQRPQHHDATSWRPPGALIVLIVIALAAAVLALWLIGS